jgi:DNA-binding MarR family transcriptional regulator
MPTTSRKTTAAEPQGCTNFKLRQLTRRVSHHYDHELAKTGLKTTQYSLLSHIAVMGPINPGKLAKAMTMDASTLSRNLKPLIDAGWVSLKPGADARSRLVVITDAGLALRAQAKRHWKAAQLSLNRLLGVEHVAALHALLDASLESLLLQESGAEYA